MSEIAEPIKQTLTELMSHDGQVTFDGLRIFHNGKLVGIAEQLNDGRWMVHQETLSFYILPFAIVPDRKDYSWKIKDGDE